MSQNSLRRNSVISLFSLFFQSGYSAVLGFAANIALTIFLEPRIFGIYITVLSVIALLNYFSDIGLAASLIQRKKISDDDVKTAFTMQQMLILTVISIAYFATDFVVSFYDLPAEGKVLYWALLLSFFMSSLKTIPSVFLERDIQFQKVVMVQILENSVFYIAVMIFAWQGYGLLSFAYSVVARAIVGVVFIYYLSFWMPKIGISRKSAKHLLSFGLPFQSMSFLALIKDEFVNLFLGKIIGFEGLGYIGWAKKWAESPLRIIMDNVSRVLFPLFARVQKDKSKQRQLIEKLLKYQTLIMFPATIGLILVMPYFVQIIPKYQKWEIALPLFYIFAVSGFLSSYSTPFINFFNGIGKVKVSFSFMVMWTVLTWVLIIPLTSMYGMLGFPLVVLALSSTSVIVIFMARKETEFEFFTHIKPYIFSGISMGIVLFLIGWQFTIQSYLGIILYIAAGMALYAGTLLTVFKINVVQQVLQIVRKS